MAIIKCKMCGGDIVLSEDKTCGTCEYCGSTMTFPKVSDEQRLNLFNRANHFRRANEFDKAINAYEKILDQDDTDAEAHWGAVLSRYGIEYVEDPVSHERIPTCHRVQPTSILTDQDYLAALDNAPDGSSRELYEKEAQRIAEIQKGILAISAKEKPYDVFICYKETAEDGSRTKDSTLAQDIYYQLTNAGYKVFFSRITLEEKLGQQYEPYIFAALNSARVMLVIGTKPEHFNAVWVKNEWSRYLDLMRKDRTKLLIPCYRDMDPYDLPEELSALQSQDMGKIGFMQDIIRGVKKVLEAEKQEQASAAQPQETVAAPGVESLLTRAKLFLEDGDWNSANEYADRVLDIDPTYAPAYMVKVCVALKLNQEEELTTQMVSFADNTNFQKALRFADEQKKAVYKEYAQAQEQKQIYIQDYQAAKAVLADVRKHYQQAKTEVANQQFAIESLQKSIEQNNLALAKARGLFQANRRKKLEQNSLELADSLASQQPLLKQSLAELQKREGSFEETKLDYAEKAYNLAGMYYKAKMYADAYQIYRTIVYYKDVENIIVDEKMSQASLELVKLWKGELSVGETTTMGSYKQGDSSVAENEPIEWLVLAKDDESFTLVSKYVIDCKPYNKEYITVDWESCTLRSWLNSVFFESAFNEEEQQMIVPTKVSAEGNTEYETAGGDNTLDKVYLLSISEANRLFDSNKSRTCQPTAYAKAEGISVDDSGNCLWWLRNPGSNAYRAVNVGNDGSIRAIGLSADGKFGIRPAIRITRL